MSHTQPRPKWRHFASHLTLNNDSIERVKKDPIHRFSPSRSQEKNQEYSLARAIQNLVKGDEPSILRTIKKRSTFSPQARQNLTYLEMLGDSHVQNLTYVMSKGNLQRKQSLNDFVLKDKLNNDAILNQIDHEHEAVQSIKREFLFFKKTVLEELKKYENEIQKSIKQIYEFMEQQIKQIKNSQLQSQIKEESRISTIKLNDDLGQQRTLSVSKSFDCLRVNMVSPFDDLHEEAETKQQKLSNKFRSIKSPKASPKFDKFFEIMQKLKETVDKTINPHQQRGFLKQATNFSRQI